MIFLKKYFQNWKGLKKLGTKHVPHTPKENFQKSKNFEFFQKRGVKEVKKLFFWKNISKIEKGFKNWVLNMCHMPPKEKKKFEGFCNIRRRRFQKRGVKGVKKWKLWKNTSKTEKGFKNWILNMCHTPQKTKKIFWRFLWHTKEEVSKKGG